LPTGKNFDNGEIGLVDKNFIVFNRRRGQSDMDAEDLSKSAITTIDDWLDEEIVGFEPDEGCYLNLKDSPKKRVTSFYYFILTPST
jgi:hypothetical protein